MIASVLLSALMLQSGVVGRAQAAPPSAAPAPATDWLVVVAAPVYQPDGGVTMETMPLPSTGAGLVHVFARRSVCDPAVTGPVEPKDAGFGWRVASQVVSRSDRDLVVSLDWRRLWDGGRKLPNGPGGTVQLTLHPGDRIPLDQIVNATPRADCRAVGMGLEVRLGRAPASAPMAMAGSLVPIGSTPGGAKPVDAEFWLTHRLPSGAEQVTHQIVRLPVEGGKFGFAPTAVEAAGGSINVQITGSIDRYRTPAGGEFLVLSMTRLVTGDGLPAAGVSSTTGTPFLFPSSPTDVVSFEMPGAPGRGGAGGGGGARGGGGGGAVTGAGTFVAAGGAGAAGVQRGGGGGGAGTGTAVAGRGGARGGGAASQVATLLEGHQFELRLRVTQVN